MTDESQRTRAESATDSWKKLASRRPIARFESLRLYQDRLEERRAFGKKVYALKGVEARVDSAGRSLTLSKTAHLSIVGPGVAITRELKGGSDIKKAVQFAAKVTAQAKAGEDA